MKYPYASRGPLWLAIVLSLCGIGFCVSAALGMADNVCVTNGCALLKGSSLFGVSLWWWGVAAYSLIGAACLLGAPALACLLAVAMLAGDCFFLAWMAFVAPCLNCLVVAVLFLLLTLVLMPPASSRMGIRRVGSLVIAVWFFMLAPNLFGMAYEAAGPWPVLGAPDAAVRVYFSPGCPVCRTTVTEFLSGSLDNVAFYPVLETEDDVSRIHRLASDLEAGIPARQAFAACFDPDADTQASFVQSFPVRLRTMVNALALIRAGATRIPVVLTSGRLAQPAAGSTAPASPLSGKQFFMTGQETFSGCDQTDTSANCSDPAPAR
ncbi:MAG: hypothetical protein AB7E47_08745 [Desulfovibrionaceae bacterium]